MCKRKTLTCLTATSYETTKSLESDIDASVTKLQALRFNIIDVKNILHLLFSYCPTISYSCNIINICIISSAQRNKLQNLAPMAQIKQLLKITH